LRNVLCPYYNGCLDHAVEKDLPGWDCGGCDHRAEEIYLPEQTDFAPEWLLLHAIFEPEKYKRYRQIEALKVTLTNCEGGSPLEDGMAMKKLLKYGEAAEKLNCSESTVRRLVDDRKLEACKVRGGNRIIASSLYAYVRSEILNFQLKNGEPEYPADEKDFQI
jgi:excisionase family DNA binding protein